MLDCLLERHQVKMRNKKNTFTNANNYWNTGYFLLRDILKPKIKNIYISMCFLQEKYYHRYERGPVHAVLKLPPGPNVLKLLVHNLRIFVIGQSVCPWQAFPAQSNEHTSQVQKFVNYRQKSFTPSASEREIPWRLSHPSFIHAECCLTSVLDWELVYPTQ